jgi:hypothetical protein
MGAQRTIFSSLTEFCCLQLMLEFGGGTRSANHPLLPVESKKGEKSGTFPDSPPVFLRDMAVPPMSTSSPAEKPRRQR